MFRLGVILTVVVLVLAQMANAAHSVTLQWIASSTPTVTYDVYRSTNSGSGYTQINQGAISVDTFVDNFVTAGVTYYYVVEAVDNSGTHSPNSNIVAAPIPAPPAAPGQLTDKVK